MKMMKQHEAAVNQLAATVQALYARQEPFRIFHGSTNSTRPIQKDCNVVDISALSNIVEIDPVRKVVIVEPNVPMDTLVEATLEHGLVPPVVMEFPRITVGGGFAGTAGESSSFRHDYFDHTVNCVEMVLANGEIVTASRNEHPDLFKAAAGALGTLGITTLLELQLLPAKKFVKTTYRRTNNVHDTIRAIRRETEDTSSNPDDYIDGIIFSESDGVVITGQLTDENPPESIKKPQTFSKPWDPWFYLHVKAITDAYPLSPVTEYIPLAEYLFRYDRGGFWVGAEAFRYFGFVSFNRLTRWLLDDLMHTRMLYWALHGSNMSSSAYMVQDLSLPYSTVEEFIDYTSQELGIWPLWLCPLREMESPTFHPYTTLPDSPDQSPKPMLNIGLWGRVRGQGLVSADVDMFVEQNRRLESKLTELGGRKVLYSHTYYTEEEFWDLYDRSWYDELRRQYSATTLPTVYDKVKNKQDSKRGEQSWLQRLASKWPFAGLVGIYCALRSRDYLLHRRSFLIHKRNKPPVNS